jgi:hypothetical protein
MRYLFVFMLTLLACALFAAPRFDMKAILAHNDIVYQAPARQGWEGLPLGNGTLGVQVWQPEGTLQMQLGTPLGGVYNGGIARLRLRTAPEGLLTGMKTYTQRLSLYDATLITDIAGENGATRLTAFVDANRDVLALQCASPAPRDVLLELETWRKSATMTMDGDRLLVTDVLKVPGEPDYRFAVAVGADGAAAVEVADAKNLRLRLKAGTATCWVAVAGSLDPKADVAAEAKAKLAAAQADGFAKAHAAHAAWWANFWNKSFIQLRSDDGAADYLANLWYMHIYAMGSGSRGEVPPKFNGGLWLDTYDEREWGPCYWHWNTQETVWPLYAANHLELLAPYYRMYFAMMPNVEKQTKAYFGVDGAHFEETIAYNGGWASGKGPKETGVHPRLATPKGTGCTNLIYSSSAEIAMQYWWNYLYTGDTVFLRERAYPLMKSVGQFYLDYLEKDAKGCYSMYPSNSHETYQRVKNPSTDLAALRYLFPTLIAASTTLGVDADLRPVWQEHLDHLAPYTIDPDKGNILPFEPLPNEKIPTSNGENPDLFPVGVFPLITLGSPDYDLGLKTYQNRKFVDCYGWTTDSIAAARLGLAGEMDKRLTQHAVFYQDHPSGLQDYYPRKPATHPYLEGSGTFATGMNEMLLQSWRGAVRVCPALPKSWDAAFKLLAMGGFEVSGTATQGAVATLTITSLRGGPLTLVNPYPKPARVSCNGKAVANTATDPALITIATEAGKTYEVGTSPFTVIPLDQTPWYNALTPNAAPKHLNATSQRWIGKPESLLGAWKPPVEANMPQPPAPVASITRPANPEVKPARFAAAPVIDGELTDDAWNNAALLGPFFLAGKTTPAGQQTDVRMGYDEKNLYLGVICWEDQVGAQILEYLPENHDGNVFMDDCLEFFLLPFPNTLWHVAVNPLGAVYDARGLTAAEEQKGLNLPLQVKTTRKANRWIVEVAIPFNALVPEGPAAGASWGFNICRTERPHGETTTFAPLSRVLFHAPAEFARLLFAHGTAATELKPVLPELVGCWSGAGLNGLWVRDAGGRGLHAQVMGAIKTAPGKIGTGLQFAGGYLDIPDAPPLNCTTGLTMMAWIKPDVRSGARLIDKGLAGHDSAYMVDMHPFGNLRVITGRGGLYDPVELPVNAWSHVAVTYGNGALRLYLNGQLLREHTGMTLPLDTTTLPLHIGADSGGGSVFSGIMDAVSVWNRPLSVEEIRRYMGEAVGR